ncbi:(4Fe-4S) cluster-containing protein [Owenweeksia hongkongensis DSM 17368]|uniref:(4Fe-4S) cluster-containing protein n=1 Tax=Owenweeksia hongkongensis (strain DSM 17368 / CIP 108786 / JCM 12287 / NRRL B-23963 / UST20020801) TaxID=926562 RepID=G8R318_OWEHD|nr:LutB/LldF family L-lactate oxidation iron-sulfur protein [Owenweeksia hongkongensis]AEV33012.1 (4Fe-4S) cluster-containing protein [Owenweeksia hongkongensis DSM 17368]
MSNNGHPKAAAKFLTDQDKVTWHDETLWQVRKKRDASGHSIPEWEELRELASQVKANVLSNLDNYLEEFEKNATANGIHVHWAIDGEEHNRIVLDILKKNNAEHIVKSKSILTEECHLNPYLEKNGIEVIDTDLGERIMQLAKTPPSHIVLPAIHMKKKEIGQLFHQKLNTEEGSEDAVYLTHAARAHLRGKFLSAKAAITGVNFAIAETGGFVVCTNEGNADMGTHLADVQIACMGIEKIIPRMADLGIFLRLLARSATGQSITNYNSHFLKPRKGQELHIVLVDNGRTKQLARKKFKNSLKCIRCGACMNTCPIYRRSGGYSYGSIVPGPIGSILSPGTDLKKYSTLPFASTLCGSCSDVCPVKINIHEQLYEWRQEIAKNHEVSASKEAVSKAADKVFANPTIYKGVIKMARIGLKYLPRPLVYNSLNDWGKHRELPEVPKMSFKEWYHKNGKDE